MAIVSWRSWQTWSVSTAAERLARARLYLVCDAPPPEFLEAVLRGGVDVVQLRMKNASAESILAVARTVVPACRRHGALFILNDRPDLVAAVGADGVHIGQDDGPVERAREFVGPQRIVGLSTHTPDQIDAAEDVDYIGVGPVHSTPTKPGRPAVGLELVRYAAAHARVPFFAIGGINPGNVRDVARAGARRVAVVRALTDSTAPERDALTLRLALLPQEVPVGSA
jgi:thiamine-phosphate pyrophosphorylase